MNKFGFLLVVGAMGWNTPGFAECIPRLDATSWLTKNVYQQDGGTVNEHDWMIDGDRQPGVKTTITIQNAVAKSSNQLVRTALSNCSRNNGYSIKLIKAWHPDRNNDDKTIHATIGFREPNAGWVTCHVYARSNHNGSALGTSCSATHPVDWVVYHKQQLTFQ